MVEGVSGLLRVAGLHRQRVIGNRALGRCNWPNESKAQLFLGDSAVGSPGSDMISSWRTSWPNGTRPGEAWVNLEFGLLRGTRPRAPITMTPKPMQLLTRGSTVISGR